MSLISLNIGQPLNFAAPLAPPDPVPITREVGLSGTSIFSGFPTDLGEYIKEFSDWQHAVRTYEEMRRSDATVALTLMTPKLLIRQMRNWTVMPPPHPGDLDQTPASSLEKEITGFVQENLFERTSWKRTLSNALLSHDYGAAAHEDCYAIDDDRFVLSNMAPRHARTFYRWNVAPDGETLRGLVQMGYRGQQFDLPEIPASKLALFTYRGEDMPFQGVSMLRPAYKHWYIKQGIEQTEAIGIERNCMAIPHIKLGPNTKTEDRNNAVTWAENIAANEQAALVTPNGWDAQMMGISGSIRDTKDAIHYHQTCITLVCVGQVLMLGEGAKGSHSLGTTLSDLFTLGVQSMADDIAETMNRTTVPRLVRYNYGDYRGAGPGSSRSQIRLPRLAVLQLASLDFAVMMKAIADCGNVNVDAIRFDDGFEKWFRDKIGAPPADLATTRIKKQGPSSEAQGPSPAAPSAPSGKQQDAQMSELKLRRQPQGYEKFLALSEIVGQLDSGRDRCAELLRVARKDLQTEILAALLRAKPGNLHRVSIPTDAALVAQLKAVLDDVSQFGRAQVGQEKARQRRGASAPTAAEIRGASLQASSANDAADETGLYAESEVSDFLRGLQTRAQKVVTDLKRDGTMRPGQMMNAAEESLAEQSDRWIDGVAAEGANNAFAAGRADGYEENKDDIASCYYSAILDDGTCDACDEADGEEGATPDDITSVPNPDCDGGNKCRCVQVFVFRDEEKS
jgi:hypothetical protein